MSHPFGAGYMDVCSTFERPKFEYQTSTRKISRWILILLFASILGEGGGNNVSKRLMLRKANKNQTRVIGLETVTILL